MRKPLPRRVERIHSFLSFLLDGGKMLGCRKSWRLQRTDDDAKDAERNARTSMARCIHLIFYEPQQRFQLLIN